MKYTDDFQVDDHTKFANNYNFVSFYKSFSYSFSPSFFLLFLQLFLFFFKSTLIYLCTGIHTCQGTWWRSENRENKLQNERLVGPGWYISADLVGIKVEAAKAELERKASGVGIYWHAMIHLWLRFNHLPRTHLKPFWHCFNECFEVWTQAAREHSFQQLYNYVQSKNQRQLVSRVWQHEPTVPGLRRLKHKHH